MSLSRWFAKLICMSSQSCRHMISLACCCGVCCSVTVDWPLAEQTLGVTSITIGNSCYFGCQMLAVDFNWANGEMGILNYKPFIIWCQFLIRLNCRCDASQISGCPDGFQTRYKGTLNLLGIKVQTVSWSASCATQVLLNDPYVSAVAFSACLQRTSYVTV